MNAAKVSGASVAITLMATLGCDSNLPLDVEGQQCGAAGECLVGYVCERGRNICVRVGLASASTEPTTCELGETICDGHCVLLNRDPEHCMKCGVTCAAPAHGIAVCESGCDFVCEPGFLRCGALCVDTASDPAHCGDCGVRCGSGQSCSNGQCSETTGGDTGGSGDGGGELACAAGYRYCDGRCVDVLNDVLHCGTCGNACAPTAGMSARCSNGQCVVECMAPTTMCAGLCVDTSTDLVHCGKCNAPCRSVAHGTTSCAGGKCLITCEPNYTLCRGKCVDLLNDPRNCGTCAHSCKACVLGVCIGEDKAGAD